MADSCHGLAAATEVAFPAAATMRAGRWRTSNDVDAGLSKPRLLGRGVGDKESQYQPARALAESVRDRLVVALQEAQLVGHIAPSTPRSRGPVPP
jgi:hypothetical protein